MNEVRLVHLTFLQFGLAAAMDSDQHKAVTLQMMKNKLGAANVFPWLTEVLPHGDFSLYIGDRDGLGRAITALLAAEAEGFAGRERRKLGIENNGICYLLSLTAELIQSLKWTDDRLPPPVLN